MAEAVKKSSIPLPQSKWRRFIDSDAPFDLLSAIAGAGTGAGGAYRFFTTDPAIDPNAATFGWILVVGVVVAVLSQIGKALRRHRTEAARDDLHEMEGCLHTLNAVLLSGDDANTAGLRSTLYVPRAGKLIQVLEYVGNDRKRSTVGREMLPNVGVVGKAFREAALFSGARVAGSTREDFVQQMITTYSFDDEQARALDASTESWIAAPIGERGSIQAVLYCDSIQRDFFSEPRQHVVAYAAVGIAYYVGLRYH